MELSLPHYSTLGVEFGTEFVHQQLRRPIPQLTQAKLYNVLSSKSPLHIIKSTEAGVNCVWSKLLFNAKQLIVLGHTVAAAGASSLNLSGVCGHSNVCNRRVFRL